MLEITTHPVVSFWRLACRSQLVIRPPVTVRGALCTSTVTGVVLVTGVVVPDTGTVVPDTIAVALAAGGAVVAGAPGIGVLVGATVGEDITTVFVVVAVAVTGVVVADTVAVAVTVGVIVDVLTGVDVFGTVVAVPNAVAVGTEVDVLVGTEVDVLVGTAVTVFVMVSARLAATCTVFACDARAAREPVTITIPDPMARIITSKILQIECCCIVSPHAPQTDLLPPQPLAEISRQEICLAVMEPCAFMHD